MRIIYFLILFILFSSCGKKNDQRNTPSVDKIEQALNLETEINLLSKSGLHFARLSNLQDPKRPMTLYCSNTKNQNHEKIERLREFSEILKLDNQPNYLINKTDLSIETIFQLIEDAIKMLEHGPYSTICPQIYLAIQSN